MGTNLLWNGDFERDWSEEKSHECFVFKPGGAIEVKNVGNIFTPPGWATWFWHYPVPGFPNAGYDQPEVRDTVQVSDPSRKIGTRSMCLFTFERRHDAGFLQQVDVELGTWVRFSAMAHAWSNHPLDGYDWCKDKGECSVGVGVGAQYILEGDAPALNGDPWNDAKGNFTFYLGIDPTGGINPNASTVVWGQGAHIYNTFASVPEVEAMAEGETVTVFLRSKTLWAFKHNDAYWDQAALEVVDAPPTTDPNRGKPRIQYERTYVLLPPSAGADWAAAIVAARWDSDRWTIGGSADDAGIGDLDARRVIAVNPHLWTDDLLAFFETYYPGVEYVPIEAATPEALQEQLEGL